jgi:fatty-acyl-CoA synthase
MARHYSEAITIGDNVLRAADRHPDSDAVVFLEERLTWAEVAARARELARGLMGMGVAPGERVGLLMANSPDCVASIFAVAMCGAVLVPINTRYRAVELPYVITNADLVAILTSDRIDEYVDLPGLLFEALPGLAGAPDPHAIALESAPALRSVTILGSRRSPGALAESDLLELADAVSEDDLDRRRRGVRLGATGLVLYTSGTTALPRGAILAHESLVRSWIEIGRIYRLTADDRVWTPCPLFHLGGIGPTMMCAATGAAILTDTFFSPDRGLALLERERATILYSAYPPITQGILAHPEFDAARLPAARAMLNVAPPDTLRQMQSALPQVTQLSLYGLTEGGGPIANNTLDDDLDTRVTTCGRALPGAQLRVVDPETRQPLGPGEPGEIAVNGVSVARGYLKDPEKTAAQFDAEGWFYTGDHGVLDECERLRFLGRLKEMLKVGGENVAPAEVEAVLGLHPAVKLVQVVGVPDPRLDEVVAAFVEVRSGSEVSEAELLEHCRGQIASFKVPRHIRFVTEWPMSATKVQREPLRRRLIDELNVAGPGA